MKHYFGTLLALLVYAGAVTVLSAQPAQVRVVSVDSTRIGGLYNFRFPVKDAQLLREKLGGHELEISFEPEWQTNPDTWWWYTGIYARKIQVRDNTTGEFLAEYHTRLQQDLCDTAVWGSFAEFAGHFTGKDTAGMGLPDSREIQAVSGMFTSDVPCLFPNYIADALGLEFDYTILQYGGIYRSDTIMIARGQANTHVARNTLFGTAVLEGVLSPDNGVNNGPGIYEVEFLPGGTETIATAFGDEKNRQEATFEVPYLTMRMRNLISYKRPGEHGDSVVVTYPAEVRHQTIAVSDSFPFPWFWEIGIGNCNLTSYGWIDGREKDGFRDRPLQAANMNTGRPIGTQGRYYLSTQDPEGHTIDFTHVVVVAGTEFGLDFANKCGRHGFHRYYDKSPQQPTVDFRPGDKVLFSTFGGALGFPLPGAKVVVHIDTVLTDVAETGPDADASVLVAPNPFQSQATISYTLPRTTHVTFTVLDRLGRIVAVPVDGKVEAGRHETTLDGRGLADGVYWYRLQTDSGVTTGTITLVR